MSEDLDRMSVTLPPDLLGDLDGVVDAGDYDSRSEATRDALRAFVTEFNRQTDLAGALSGTVVVLYDHDDADVAAEMTSLQHEFADTIIAVHHVHLRSHLCLESIAVDGDGEDIEALLARLRPLKGVQQVKLTVVEVDSETDHHS
ncbi:nickel-responsive transcriptional regulator NikR (plasmid) [Halarchaeum sp. CBA1220]|uniref:nickel-responsive transcriptional regulator NikR n=1 Tax=Halarchaeum sp. CBA1220 TaxID=1853682 RepID=UPI000F3AA08D|nr:nickel-responsive transcriptional regulator NikR [Halarchaeum sp. CBA1220]QLC34910.1 nickel-responsive transcriptional regulator NikR [Halarchaeum sp. CBA1220]